MMNDNVKIIAGVVLACVYISGLIILAWHGIITGDQCLGAAGAVALPTLGALLHNNGVKAGTQAALINPTTTVTMHKPPELVGKEIS